MNEDEAKALVAEVERDMGVSGEGRVGWFPLYTDYSGAKHYGVWLRYVGLHEFHSRADYDNWSENEEPFIPAVEHPANQERDAFMVQENGYDTLDEWVTAQGWAREAAMIEAERDAYWASDAGQMRMSD